MTAGGGSQSESKKPPSGCLASLMLYLAMIAVIVLTSTLGDPAPEGIVYPAISAAGLLIILSRLIRRFRPEPRPAGARAKVADLTSRVHKATPTGKDAIAVSRKLLHSFPFVAALLLLITFITAVAFDQPAAERSGRFGLRFDALLVSEHGEGDLSRVRLDRMDFRIDPTGPDGIMRSTIDTVLDLRQVEGRFKVYLRVPVGAVPNSHYWPRRTLPGEKVTFVQFDVRRGDRIDPEILDFIRPTNTVVIEVDPKVLAENMRATYPQWTPERVSLPTIYLDIPDPAGVRREGLGVRSFVLEMGRTIHTREAHLRKLRIGDVPKTSDIADGARLVVGPIDATTDLDDASLVHERELDFNWTRPEPDEMGEGYRAWQFGPRGEQIEFALVTSRRLVLVRTYAGALAIALLSYCLARIGQAWLRQREFSRSHVTEPPLPRY